MCVVWVPFSKWVGYCKGISGPGCGLWIWGLFVGVFLVVCMGVLQCVIYFGEFCVLFSSDRGWFFVGVCGVLGGDAKGRDYRGCFLGGLRGLHMRHSDCTYTHKCIKHTHLCTTETTGDSCETVTYTQHENITHTKCSIVRVRIVRVSAKIRTPTKNKPHAWDIMYRVHTTFIRPRRESITRNKSINLNNLFCWLFNFDSHICMYMYMCEHTHTRVALYAFYLSICFVLAGGKVGELWGWCGVERWKKTSDGNYDGWFDTWWMVRY